MRGYALLPVCYCCVEYLVGDVLAHLCYEFFLYVYKLLCGIVGAGCCELLFEVIGVVLVVCESDVYGHLQLHLIGVATIGYTFVELVKTNNFAFQYKVAVSLNLFQSCLTGEDVGEFVLEDRLHWSPYIGATDGEVAYLYAFYLGVVYACSVELIADGA